MRYTGAHRASLIGGPEPNGKFRVMVSTAPKRRWFQFSLWTLLGLMLILSVPLSWYGLKEHDRRQQMKEARRNGPFLQSPNEQQIRAELDKDTVLEFDLATLNEVVEFLQQYHSITIVIDRRALDDTGSAFSVKIDKDIRGIPLRSGLEILLRELGLTYVVRHDVLLITTPEHAESLERIGVYYVGDLLDDGGDVTALAEACRTSLAEQDRTTAHHTSGARRLRCSRFPPHHPSRFRAGLSGRARPSARRREGTQPGLPANRGCNEASRCPFRPLKVRRPSRQFGRPWERS